MGTIVAYEVGVFGEEIGKFQGVEVWITCRSYYNPMNGDIYILIFEKYVFFGDFVYASLIPPNHFIKSEYYLIICSNSSPMDGHYMVSMYLWDNLS